MDRTPKGNWEYLGLAVVVLVVGTLLWSLQDPTMDLSVSEIQDLLEFADDLMRGIADEGGPL